MANCRNSMDEASPKSKKPAEEEGERLNCFPRTAFGYSHFSKIVSDDESKVSDMIHSWNCSPKNTTIKQITNFYLGYIDFDRDSLDCSCMLHSVMISVRHNLSIKTWFLSLKLFFSYKHTNCLWNCLFDSASLSLSLCVFAMEDHRLESPLKVIHFSRLRNA